MIIKLSVKHQDDNRIDDISVLVNSNTTTTLALKRYIAKKYRVDSGSVTIGQISAGCYIAHSDSDKITDVTASVEGLVVTIIGETGVARDADDEIYDLNDVLIMKTNPFIILPISFDKLETLGADNIRSYHILPNSRQIAKNGNKTVLILMESGELFFIEARVIKNCLLPPI